MRASPSPRRSSLVAGWIAVAVSTFFAGLWAFWGSIENFHEGWFHHEWYRNVGLALVQYLPWMFVPMFAALVALWKRWPGVLAHLALAGLAFHFFGGRLSAGVVLIGMPLVGLACLYAYGRPEPVRLARWILAGVPLAVALVSGAYPGWRTITRPAGVDLSAHRFSENGVDLIWAPAGPGWPERGFSWEQAKRRCDLLSGDGLTLSDTPQHTWRLPTVDEAVRTQIFRGRNAGGAWDSKTETVRYRTRPDKDAPLWNRYSPVIYWWTADEADPAHAYRVVYNGMVDPVLKTWGPTYLACRCVKEEGR